jgi:photosystem I subunit PsaN
LHLPPACPLLLCCSRSVSDRTCAFPNNWFGCDIGAVAGDVKFIKDDIKLECEVGHCCYACQ